VDRTRLCREQWGGDDTVLAARGQVDPGSGGAAVLDGHGLVEQDPQFTAVLQVTAPPAVADTDG
jgi:hypothetical protein